MISTPASIVLFSFAIFRFNEALVSKCDNLVPQFFTKSEKTVVCDLPSVESVMCASEARRKLKIQFNEIIALCKEASNNYPVNCMDKLRSFQSTEVKEYVILLCSGARSDISATCFSEISSYKEIGRIHKKEIVEFCKTSDIQKGRLPCFTSSMKSGLLSLNQSLMLCRNATGDYNHIDICMKKMTNEMKANKQIQNKQNLIALSTYFCSNVRSEYPLQCYDNSVAMLPRIPATDRLTLCDNATTSMGPVSCVQYLQQYSIARTHTDTVISVCQQARDAEAARCFVEGMTNTLPNSVSVALCRTATSTGPIQCFLRSRILLQDISVNQRVQLCIDSDAAAPVECASRLPSWLEYDEKSRLCRQCDVRNALEPAKCLQIVEGANRKLRLAPAKAIGIPLSSSTDLSSRQSLLRLCSCSQSPFPVEAAACMRSVPTSMNHNDAVHMCMSSSSSSKLTTHNRSSTAGDDDKFEAQCIGRLSKEWKSAESAVLCRGVTSAYLVSTVVECAESSILAPIRMSPMDAAVICNHETMVNRSSEIVGKGTSKVTGKGMVLECLRAYRAHSKGRSLNVSVVIEVCGGAAAAGLALDDSKSAGQCLGAVARQSTLTFASGAVSSLCLSSNPLSKLSCVNQLKKWTIFVDDVVSCQLENPIITSARVVKFIAENNDIEATAGKWFELTLQVYDQWGEAMVTSGAVITVSINSNNKQGAVLWGIRSNTTVHGILHLHRLSVSLPGPVELKVVHEGVAIALFQLAVKEDPNTISSLPCVDVFRHATCLRGTELDVQSEFPRERGYLDSSMYMHVISCQAVLRTWYVNVVLLPDGCTWIEYKKGIDSIWTGAGFPKIEASPIDRLELSMLNTSTKNVKRAYYKKSLMWHPDRWITMPLYSVVVTGAFEAIRLAYEQLISTI